MGFFDKLEKFAEKFDEFSQKADKWIDDNTKKKYSQHEIMLYYIDNYHKAFYDSMLSTAKGIDSKIKRLDFYAVEFGTKTIKNCGDGIYNVVMKGCEMATYDEYGSFCGYYLFELDFYVDEYLNLDLSKDNKVRVKK